MENCIHKMYIDNLVPGMYIINRNLKAVSPYVFEEEGVVESYAAIDSIRKRGYLECFVDSRRSKNIRLDESEEVFSVTFKVMNDAETLKYEGEIFRSFFKTALETYDRAAQAYIRLQTDVERGQSLDFPLIENTVEELRQGVVVSPSAMLAVTRTNRFGYAISHAINVAIIACVVGVALEVEDARLRSLCMAGFLHDIGKQKISAKVVNNPRKLSKYESSEMRRHVEYSFRAIADCLDISMETKLAVLEHHERYDGSGYPRRKGKEEVSEDGYLIGLADIFDAMLTERPYQRRTVPNKVMSTLYGLGDKAFPMQLIQAFVAAIGVYPLGSMVKLSTGYVGLVLNLNMQKPLAPRIGLLKNPSNKLVPLSYLDLSTELMATIQESIHFELDAGELKRFLVMLTQDPSEAGKEKWETA